MAGNRAQPAFYRDSRAESHAALAAVDEGPAGDAEVLIELLCLQFRAIIEAWNRPMIRTERI